MELVLLMAGCAVVGWAAGRWALAREHDREYERGWNAHKAEVEREYRDRARRAAATRLAGKLSREQAVVAEAQHQIALALESGKRPAEILAEENAAHA